MLRVRCRTGMSRVRKIMPPGCCAGVFNATKRMVGRAGAVDLERPLGEIDPDDAGLTHCCPLLLLVDVIRGLLGTSFDR
jgi:hypothetical protein